MGTTPLIFAVLLNLWILTSKAVGGDWPKALIFSGYILTCLGFIWDIYYEKK